LNKGYFSKTSESIYQPPELRILGDLQRALLEEDPTHPKLSAKIREVSDAIADSFRKKTRVLGVNTKEGDKKKMCSAVMKTAQYLGDVRLVDFATVFLRLEKDKVRPLFEKVHHYIDEFRDLYSAGVTMVFLLARAGFKARTDITPYVSAVNAVTYNMLVRPFNIVCEHISRGSEVTWKPQDWVHEDRVPLWGLEDDRLEVECSDGTEVEVDDDKGDVESDDESGGKSGGKSGDAMTEEEFEHSVQVLENLGMEGGDLDDMLPLEKHGWYEGDSVLELLQNYMEEQKANAMSTKNDDYLIDYVFAKQFMDLSKKDFDLDSEPKEEKVHTDTAKRESRLRTLAEWIQAPASVSDDDDRDIRRKDFKHTNYGERLCALASMYDINFLKEANPSFRKALDLARHENNYRHIMRSEFGGRHRRRRHKRHHQ
jgi:hypothetical protein